MIHAQDQRKEIYLCAAEGDPAGGWRVDYRDPLTRKRARVILPVSNFKDEEKEAKAINDRLGSGKGFAGRIRGSVGHTVQAAVLEAVKHSSGNERTRADYLIRYNPFSEYLAENVPGVQAWSDVTEQVLAIYMEHCRRDGVAHDTLRMRLYVLRLTSAYMSRTYPSHYRHVTANVKVRRHDPPKSELEAKDAILSPSQARGLLRLFLRISIQEFERDRDMPRRIVGVESPGLRVSARARRLATGGYPDGRGKHRDWSAWP